MSLYILGGSGTVIAAYLSRIFARGGDGFKDFHARLFKWRLGVVWYLLALGVPLLLHLTAVLATILFDKGFAAEFKMPAWYMFLAYIPIMIVGGGLEELGWRGTALPELQKRLSPLPATVILGIIWSVWHLPLFFLPGVIQYGTSFWLFALEVIGIALVMSWLYNWTDSILICVLMHAARNAAATMGFRVPTEHVGGAIFEGLIWVVLGVLLLSGLSRKAPAVQRASLM